MNKKEMNKKYSFDTIVAFVEKYDHDAINYLEPEFLDEIEIEVINKNKLLFHKNKLLIDKKHLLNNNEIENIIYNFLSKFKIEIEKLELVENDTIFFLTTGKDREEKRNNAIKLEQKLKKYKSGMFVEGYRFEINSIKFFSDIYKSLK